MKPDEVWPSSWADAREKIIELRAEVERLRAALEQITTLKAEDMYMADDNDNKAAWLARAALEPKP